MVGPLPLLAVAFLGAMLLPGVLPPLASALGALGLCLLALTDRVRVPRAAILLGAVILAGQSRSDALRLLPLARVPATEADRVRGRVVQGCLPGPRGERCLVAAERWGLVDLRFPELRCGAEPGDLIEVAATVRPIVPNRNPPRANPDTLRVLRGVAFRLDAAGCTRLGRSRAPPDVLRRLALETRFAIGRALGRALPPDGANRARALLFGDTAALDEGDLAAFRESGLAHLLAVSGAHVALLLALLGRGARAALARIGPLAERGLAVPLAALAPLPAVGFFVLVTGESASSVRALGTALLATAAGLGGRRVQGEATVAAVALGMAAASPVLVLDVGWVLSVVASWALARGSHPAEPPAATGAPPAGFVRGTLAVLAEALRTSARVAVAVTPVLAWHFGRAPCTATVMNVVAAPVGEALALPAALATAVLGATGPAALARAAGRVLAPVLAGLFALPGLAVRLPLASVPLPTPTPAECVVATLAVLAALGAAPRVAARRLLAGALLVALLEGVHRGAVHPRGVLRVTALDVGQGDALAVDLPDGAAMLIDGGGAITGGPDPGEREVVPWLALHRRGALAVVVLSHPHPDHAGGLAAVLRAVRVGALWDTGQGAALRYGGAYAAVRAAALERAVPVVGPEALCGPPRPFHGAWLEVLAPCPAVRDGDAPNDASFVLRLSVGRASVLFPGDLERGGESRLLGALAPTTVLKVPHHGSRTSSTEAFLDRLRPAVALVSCGHPSPFGHPYPEVVARYARRGIALRRTDLAGAVTVTLHPDGRVE